MTHTLTNLARTLVATLLLAFAGAALAIDTEKAFDDPALQARYEHINRELRCLVCQNQTIADSNATLAQDLRREVREMIAAGKSDDDIREFMIERYGDFVLYRPRMTGVTFLLWATPVLLLLLGTFIGIRYVRRQAALADTDSPEAGQS
ncbi:MAG TPA: cytochrome c-type biogenesis protein [Steroidobacteraceae bacterium]|nr:cytochrome c-type biogenesis protein [Steroidobacteraceae bacterium]